MGISGEDATIFIEDKAIAYHAQWAINNLEYTVSGGLPIDHTVFGLRNKTATISLKMTPSGAHFWLLFSNDLRRKQRRWLPSWKKPQRAKYPASKHRR